MPEPFFCPVPAGFDMILEFLEIPGRLKTINFVHIQQHYDYDQYVHELLVTYQHRAYHD